MSARFSASNGNAAYAMPLVTTAAGYGVPLGDVDPGTPVYGHFAGNVACCIANVITPNNDKACARAVCSYHARFDDSVDVDAGSNVCTCTCGSSTHEGIVVGAFGGCQQATATGDGVLVKLLDGRSLPCPPDQPLLVQRVGPGNSVTNQWVCAKDLQPLDNAVVCGPSFPALDDVDDSSWELRTSNHVFSMRTAEHTRCAMAFARIVGIVSNDGHVEPGRSRSTIFVGSQFDVDLVQRDVKLLSGNKANVIYRGDKKHGYVFRMRLPKTLSRSIASLDGQSSGKRTAQITSWPSFILDECCPIAIVRSFLSGAMSGDGCAPSLRSSRTKEGILRSISFTWSYIFVQYGKHVEAMKVKMEALVGLYKRCGLTDAYLAVEKPKADSELDTYSDNKGLGGKGKSNRNSILYIVRLAGGNSQWPYLLSEVSYCYCIQKQIRGEAITAYISYLREVVRLRSHQSAWAVGALVIDEFLHIIGAWDFFPKAPEVRPHDVKHCSAKPTYASTLHCKVLPIVCIPVVSNISPASRHSHSTSERLALCY